MFWMKNSKYYFHFQHLLNREDEALEIEAPPVNPSGPMDAIEAFPRTGTTESPLGRNSNRVAARPGPNVIKLLWTYLSNFRDKLECLSLS
jgi:hypothetical protein